MNEQTWILYVGHPNSEHCSNMIERETKDDIIIDAKEVPENWRCFIQKSEEDMFDEYYDRFGNFKFDENHAEESLEENS